MARPSKQGIDYFPMDVDFLSDIKTRKILRACGAQSIAILICLLCNIYRDTGYYILWDGDLPFLVADEVGTNEGVVVEVVKKAVQVGFFDKNKFEKYSILTSLGIQNRFIKASERRTKTEFMHEYCIQNVNNNLVNVDNNSINVSKSTQSKVKESKVNKSKVNNNRDEPAVADSKINIFDLYQENFGVLNPMTSETLKDWLRFFSPEMIKEAMLRALKNQKNFSYAEGILRNWRKNNIKTLEDATAEQVRFDNKMANNSFQVKRQGRVEQMPDWAKEDYDSLFSEDSMQESNSSDALDEVDPKQVESLKKRIANLNKLKEGRS